MKKLAAPMKSFGNLILMTLICIAIFIVFMALRPANAGMQGNLPTPVQALPKYPPVICVAPDWVTEICEDRQTPLPKSNPLRENGRQRCAPFSMMNRVANSPPMSRDGKHSLSLTMTSRFAVRVTLLAH